jgi:hypothetical protein
LFDPPPVVDHLSDGMLRGGWLFLFNFCLLMSAAPTPYIATSSDHQAEVRPTKPTNNQLKLNQILTRCERKQSSVD